jgi:hypothetical protein
MEKVWFLAPLWLGVATVATWPAIWFRTRFRHYRHAGPATVLRRTAGFGTREIVRSMGTESFDVFSRYVTGPLIAYRDTAGLAKRVIERSRRKREIPRGLFTSLPDPGSSITSQPLASLFANCAGVTNHGSPRLGDDGSFSEARFHILEYEPRLSRSAHSC